MKAEDEKQKSLVTRKAREEAAVEKETVPSHTNDSSEAPRVDWDIVYKAIDHSHQGTVIDETGHPRTKTEWESTGYAEIDEAFREHVAGKMRAMCLVSALQTIAYGGRDFDPLKAAERNRVGRTKGHDGAVKRLERQMIAVTKTARAMGATEFAAHVEHMNNLVSGYLAYCDDVRLRPLWEEDLERIGEMPLRHFSRSRNKKKAGTRFPAINAITHSLPDAPPEIVHKLLILCGQTDITLKTVRDCIRQQRGG